MNARFIGLVTFGALGLMGCVDIDLVPVKTASPAPKPLYRDPIYDGAADASVVYDKKLSQWRMFYTNRRATLKFPNKDVSWVHGTPIGVAISKDGINWSYLSTAKIPASCTGKTLWAPELYEENGTYHMWVTVVPGIFSDWEHERFLVHLTSPDLDSWQCEGRVDTGTDRAIDASLMKTEGIYRLWFNDETNGKKIFELQSTDLKTWTRSPKPVSTRTAEGPKVFSFGGKYWLIADVWKGLMVLRSDDLSSWVEQPDRLLETPGTFPTDNDKGQHPDVVVNDGRALIYYFVHQNNAPEAQSDPAFGQRTVIQVAELRVTPEGWLSVDRNAPVNLRLKPPVIK